MMKATIDGDSICIVQDDFVNLQESPAIFIPLEGLRDEDLKMISDDICGMEGCPEWGEQEPGVLSGCGKCIWCIAHEND